MDSDAPDGNAPVHLWISSPNETYVDRSLPYDADRDANESGDYFPDFHLAATSAAPSRPMRIRRNPDGGHAEGNELNEWSEENEQAKGTDGVQDREDRNQPINEEIDQKQKSDDDDQKHNRRNRVRNASRERIIL